jgi:hypothetical protein
VFCLRQRGTTSFLFSVFALRERKDRKQQNSIMLPQAKTADRIMLRPAKTAGRIMPCNISSGP